MMKLGVKIGVSLEVKDADGQLQLAHWLAFSRAPNDADIQFAREAMDQLKVKWKTEMGGKAQCRAQVIALVCKVWVLRLHRCNDRLRYG